MSKLLPSSHCRLALQLGAAVAAAALMSGCSADSTRLGDPFGNPFSTASSDAAPTAPPRRVASSDVIPAGRTPPVSSQALAPRAANLASASPHRGSTSMAFHGPVSHETTGSIEPAPARVASNTSFGGWTSTGGTPIQVADGENATVLAQRYGVPTSALLQVNGLRTAADIHPGSRITVPVYSATAHAAPQLERSAQAAPKADDRRPISEPRHAARERLASAQRAPFRTEAAVTPKALMGPTTHTAAGRQSPKPIVAAHVESGAENHKHGISSIATKTPAATAKTALTPTAPKITASKLAPVQQAAAIPGSKATVKTATLAAPKGETFKAAPVDPAPTASTVPAASVAIASPDGTPEFRWPARGRIIQSFKGGSGGNDGINIAVPEGTSVRAAESGVVAYAGSELKGYGNLVLIRHPNGFVSAYANNGQIDVKRGETVKRGQEIAKSGQSGNVSSPQLHFELRKGSTPVDPTQFLAGL